MARSSSSAASENCELERRALDPTDPFNTFDNDWSSGPRGIERTFRVPVGGHLPDDFDGASGAYEEEADGDNSYLQVWDQVDE